ncbi:hypothetical protein [Klebsiella sp. BIGb0407]|uniref:hypothetical protein n=1 Tax=Klebsiella sp. BIGb0407 TaxID=2940603 RepID=UPI002167F818|nr:hypothetical protein [Klebsiella sp. BIGb0407]MCS3434036.1 hypothetical protein [Klebsiella sp. BIGb0407]
MSNKKTNKSPASERKEKSRKNLEQDFGPQMIFNIDDEVNMRLREICVHFGHLDMLTKQKHLARNFNESIADIINYYYITQIVTPQNKDIKSLIKAFKTTWRYAYKNKDSNNKEDIKSTLIENKKIKPILISNKSKKNDEWTEDDVENILNTTNVLNIIAKNNTKK